MSQPVETHTLPPLIPNGETQALGPAGASIENPASLQEVLDHDFNFQIVVFKVENTLFKVLRNGFNVPGTPFEAMFALPQTQTDNIEGSSLENPIHLRGVKVDHFRSFLRVLYPLPFINQKPVDKFEEWVGVLNLATMWFFKEIRARAITELSVLIKRKTAMERIALAREYRVVSWLRDAYIALAQKKPLDIESLRPAEPCFTIINSPLDRNWEEDAKKWEATSRDWETVARIFYLQIKVAVSIGSARTRTHCRNCYMDFGGSTLCLCKCRLLRLVDETFRRELESLGENLEYVDLPQALPLVVDPFSDPAFDF